MLEEKLAQLPTSPGIYLMKDDSGKVIYVGKAKNLRNRVRSYFRQQPKEAVKTKALVRHIADFEYIIVDSESEALVLECNFIKKYNPKYNINLKDGKTYPYVRITNEPFPKLFVTRQMVRDGSHYFGPYPSVYQLRETVELLHQIFKLRTCSNARFNKGEPCLNAHIERCEAPCVGRISREAYQHKIEQILAFFSGQNDTLEQELEKAMLAASEALDFEEAARKRDQLRGIQAIHSQQKAVMTKDQDQDYVAMVRNDLGAMAQVFFVRGGKLLGRESYPLKTQAGDSDEEIFSSFLKQFYLSQVAVPKEIEIYKDFEEAPLLAQLLTEKHQHKVSFHVPQRGAKKALMDLVERNAGDSLAKRPVSAERQKERTEGALIDLQEYLSLDSFPKRIECYDISNIQGSDSVASMVVFVNGRPQKDQYRKFKIKTVEGPNDFASMAEVINRRFARATKELEAGEGKNGFAWLPDLVIIDGGKGQLGYAREAMRQQGYGDIPTFGLAKQEELLFKEDEEEPIVLPRESNALYLIQRLRDESHRFAITFHRSLRGKRQLASVLDEIPGVGKKRKESLLTHFGSFSKILSASLDDLKDVEGISEGLAETIYIELKNHQALQAKIQSRLKQNINHRRKDDPD